jgi:organic hydroperoxide reductase OsmC/OhrA
MTVMKEMQFPVSVRWRGGRLARADARERKSFEVATPPEFRGGLSGYWSPEDLLVTSVASCFALTLAAVAESRDAPPEEAVRQAARAAEQRCVTARALDVPVHVGLSVKALAAA